MAIDLGCPDAAEGNLEIWQARALALSIGIKTWFRQREVMAPLRCKDAQAGPRIYGMLQRRVAYTRLFPHNCLPCPPMHSWLESFLSGGFGALLRNLDGSIALRFPPPTPAASVKSWIKSLWFSWRRSQGRQAARPRRCTPDKGIPTSSVQWVPQTLDRLLDSSYISAQAQIFLQILANVLQRARKCCPCPPKCKRRKWALQGVRVDTCASINALFTCHCGRLFHIHKHASLSVA